MGDTRGRRFPELPVMVAGASSDQQPHRARPEHQRALGFPETPPPDWQARAVARMRELLDGNRALRVAMDACMRCGACTDKCHFYLGTGDPNNMPVARQELFRKVYRRHFTLAGRLFPWLVGAQDFSEDVLAEWYTYFHQCSQCRRCAVFCPVGIDTAEVSMAARDIMNHIGYGQRYSNEVIAKVEQTGNNLGMPVAALRDTLESLEEDVLEETGVPVRLPLDEPGAEVLLVTPSADFFAEPHVDGLIGYAKVMHAAGISWTLSSHAAEGANFALFIGARGHMATLAERIRAAALDLGARRLVFGECGHAWRVAHNDLPRLAGGLDFLDPRWPVPQHIVELTLELLARGAIEVDPAANDDYRVTFHDSCNIARGSSMGGSAEGAVRLPREVLRRVCNHFHDMREDAIGERTFCCGGGGGLLTDELMEVRVAGAKPRMQAFAEVVERHGVTHLVAMCAICKTQFAQVLPRYGFRRDAVLSLHHLVGNAIRLGARR